MDDEEVYVTLEREVAVFMRRARAVGKDLAHEVHPDLEADAYGLLIRIATAEGARGTDLADYFGIGKPTVSRQVRMLEDLGLVERRSDPGDARAALFVLTEEGASRVARMRAARRARFRELLEPWSSEEASQLAVLLGRLNAIFEAS